MSRLTAILDHKRVELVERKAAAPRGRIDALCEQRRRAEESEPAARRGFAAALRTGDPVAVIAEVKRASPSAGVIRDRVDPADRAAAYCDAGAAAVSVLTDERFFHGSLDDLRAVRARVDLPVLRKDFTVDAYHVAEAYAAGADAVLLILAALTDRDAGTFLAMADGFGIAALVEVHDEDEMRRAADLGARVIGVNARNLGTFEVDLGQVERVAPLAPAGAVVVAESGIRTAADVARVRAAGADAVLVGEALMRADDPGATLRGLLGGAVR